MTIKDALINIVGNAFDELDKQPQRVETTDYIRRESVGNLCLKNLEIINGRCYVNMEELLNLVDGIPAADVEPVRRIQWTPYADGQTDTSGFAGDDDYLLRTSTGYIVPGYWDDHFKEWTVPIEYDAAKDWADRFGQIVGFMKIQRPEDPA